MTVIDLRSDTITQPTPAMRRAMAEAEVVTHYHISSKDIDHVLYIFKSLF